MIRCSALLILLLPLPLAAADWKATGDSTLRFVGGAQGESFEGHFSRFDAKVRFDPEDLAATRFDVRIDLASADSANSERDELLHSADFFDVARFAEARFEALGASLDNGSYTSEGTLTLKGKSQPVRLHFRWLVQGETTVLEGDAVLDRLAFGVGDGEWTDADMIDHRVEVRTRLALRRD